MVHSERSPTTRKAMDPGPSTNIQKEMVRTGELTHGIDSGLVRMQLWNPST